MRLTILLGCGLLAACGAGSSSGGSEVLSSAENNVLGSGRDTVTDFGSTPLPEAGNVTFGLILNDYRIEAGVDTVAENVLLNDIAQDHAEDQVTNGYLSHTDLMGGTAGDRALAAGYDYSVIAENIARGFNDEAGVLDAWMDSPGHRDNMLDPRVDEFGVGREDTTWVLLLGAQFGGEGDS